MININPEGITRKHSLNTTIIHSVNSWLRESNHLTNQNTQPELALSTLREFLVVRAPADLCLVAPAGTIYCLFAVVVLVSCDNGHEG